MDNRREESGSDNFFPQGRNQSTQAPKTEKLGLERSLGVRLRTVAA